MAIGIYKSGQGYWTRVLTAVMIGVMTVAAAAWAWKQMTVVADKLPRSVWAMALSNIAGEVPAPGTTVTLVGEPPAGARVGEPIGTAVVQAWTPTSQELRVKDVQMTKATDDASVARAVRLESGFQAGVKTGTQGLPSVAPELLSGSAAVLIILIGFVIGYYFCATKPASSEFLISTDMEMKKVNWSTRKEIMSSTWVVVAAALLLSLSLFLIDMGFKWFFGAIGILAT